jgi:hypothetical protein
MLSRGVKLICSPEPGPNRLCPAASGERDPGGGPDARQADAPGCDLKKILKPAGKRGLVEVMKTAYKVSERRACAALGGSGEPGKIGPDGANNDDSQNVFPA